MTGRPPIPRWWRVVGALSMNLALGSLYAWSVFAQPLEARFGWDRSETSLAFTIAIACFALGFLLAGPVQDRLGPLPVSIFGGLFVSIGYFACGQVETLPGLYLWFGAVVGLGVGIGYATPIPVAAKWFPDRRGLAVGLAVAGFGGGAALFGPLCSGLLIPRYGLPVTFRILAVIFLAMTSIGALLLRNPPPGYRPVGWQPAESVAIQADHGFTPWQVLAMPTFYLMWAAYALGASSGLMVISQLVPFAKGRGSRRRWRPPPCWWGRRGTSRVGRCRVGSPTRLAGSTSSAW